MTLCILIGFTSQALAYELLVLSGERSKNSKRWQEEVLPEYKSSDIGKTIPLKEIVVLRGADFPNWLNEAIQKDEVGEIIGTPTFLIWDQENKTEAGRVEGYTQKDRFFSQMNEALAQIEQGMTPGRREGSMGHEEEGSGGPQAEGSGSHHEEGSAAKQEEGSGSAQGEGEPSMSRDIMDHMYKTPEEAKRASEMLGFGGEIHTHESPGGTIYMPGPMM